MISNILGGRKMIPVVEKMEVFPVAGHDCMELNLSGAHAPYFTRNIVILTDSNGVEGVGEVPGGEKITNALEQVKDLVIGTSIADYKQTLNKVRKWLDENINDDLQKKLNRKYPRKPYNKKLYRKHKSTVLKSPQTVCTTSIRIQNYSIT